MKRTQGFTLIELLFVIAIISTMAIFGLSAYEQLVMNRKIDRATIEMQAWLQASLRYYTDNKGLWPKDTTVLTDKNYMSNDDLPNPWDPDPLPYSPTSQYSYNVKPTFDGKSIQVFTTIPAYIKHADKIAIMIAGRLPFGQPAGNDTTGTTTVTIQMPAPATLVQQGNSIFMNVRTINCASQNGGPAICDTNSIQSFTCPPNYHPNVSVALAGFTAYGYQQSSTHTVGQVVISNLFNHSQNQWDLGANVLSSIPSEPLYGSGTIVAISTCDINTAATTKTSTSNNNNNSHYIF